MKVLAVTSEIYPLVKTGGLADVAGALPHALKPHSVETRTLVPGYPALLAKLGHTNKVMTFLDVLGERAALLEAHHEGLHLLVLDIPALYQREGGLYGDSTGADFADNWRRFAALSFVAAELAAGALDGYQPDLVHAHDWQAAMAPVYMRFGRAHAVPSVLTIHNIAFQGMFGSHVFGYLGLPPHAYAVDALEYYGHVGYLKGGLQSATAITTVSPSYAQEILQHEFGMGLEGVIASRLSDLSGIVNGIDTDVWDPDTDPHLAKNYSASSLRRRSANRAALCRRFDLDNDTGPLFCVVSRLTGQKGMDVLADVVDELVSHGGKLAILGSGEPWIERALKDASDRHPGRVGMVIGYDEPLSHLMQAGSDAIIIPSRFEPCGLTQLYALRYGCVPVVARTGGLTDTIIDANEAALSSRVATGFKFSPVTPASLSLALRRVFAAYADPQIWTRLQTRGMKSDVSWDMSAARYVSLYSRLIKDRTSS